MGDRVASLQGMLQDLESQKREAARKARERELGIGDDKEQKDAEDKTLATIDNSDDEDLRDPLTEMSSGERERDAVFQVLQAAVKGHSRIIGSVIDDAEAAFQALDPQGCLLYTSPSPRDQRGSRMPSSA